MNIKNHMNIIEKTTEFCREFELSDIENREPDDLYRDVILDRTLKFIHEEILETDEAVFYDRREDIIDGFGDIAFIALNGIYKEFRTSGDDHATAMTKTHEVMLRICQANLSKKHPDGSIIHSKGKVQKPEGWLPPAYDDLL